MLKSILENSNALSLSEYENIIENIITHNTSPYYHEKTFFYIKKNSKLERYIQQHLSLTKKMFNSIQKTKIKKIGLITEAWCLDACIILPLIKAIEIVNPTIELRIYLRDKNDELMNQYLTNGSMSIPVIFGLDENDNEIFRWGPRSTKAKNIQVSLKGAEYSDIYNTLSDFYMTDLTSDIQEEWIELF